MTRDGIQFRFTNPYQLATGDWSAYEYTGYVYPVGENLYFLSEQIQNDYEIFSIIMQDSAEPKVELLRGLVTGIGVKDGRSYIAARPFVGLRSKKRIENWEDALDKQLGYLPIGSIPTAAQKELSDERITIN